MALTQVIDSTGRCSAYERRRPETPAEKEDIMIEILFISLIHLIQDPEKYDQKTIRVVGLCSLKFENKAMWATKSDFDKNVTKNAVWLDVKLVDLLLKNHGNYMIAEGVFNAKRNGHLGMYSGTIEKISRIELWEYGEIYPNVEI